MSSKETTIIWTKVDEAPALASYSLLPVLQSFTRGCGIRFETRDISLAGRIIANFPDNLAADQKQTDDLAWLGDLVKKPEANIVKLPNISASIPQLQEAIKELQSQGYKIPDFPYDPKSDAEKALRERFAKVLGSAVNPVLREGNSDRRAAASVKKFGRKNPHTMMKDWPADSKCRVLHMEKDDFFGSEKSATLSAPAKVKIEFVSDSESTTLKESFPLLAGEIIDASVMRAGSLREFIEEACAQAKKDDTLFSLHLKATMMKVSDPIIFGHVTSVFFKDVVEKHKDTLKKLGVNFNNGLSDLYSKLESLPDADRKAIEADIAKVYESRPDLAMVDSRKGITNLHVPNNVIIDASMPNVVRDGGRMWNKDDALQDTMAVIPDRSYATMYQAIIEDCQKNGQLDPGKIGSVSNVGLMAKKAEEYGSHDKTFEANSKGTIRVVDESGKVLLEQSVDEGDIFRMCQTKDEPVRDWVKLAVTRARASGAPAVFWLDEKRAHDAEIIKKVNEYLKEHDTSGLEIKILAPVEAMHFSLERIRRGEDAISVTGNVLRDYLTDLFPIIELGTSARMLSVVPLLNGGGLFETGAGGSAPKHVQQFVDEGHLRWDSLGEFCALVASFDHVFAAMGNNQAKVLSATLDEAIGSFLENRRSPSRKVKELDNRGSQFYLSLYWAQALSAQGEDDTLKDRFAKVARDLSGNEKKILDELNEAQGAPVDLGGYYHPDDKKASAAMRPSGTWNAIIDA